MAEGTTNNNSAIAAPELLAEDVKRILIQPLVKQSVFLASGPTIFDGNGSPIRIPKQAPPIDPAWTGENEAVTESNPNFDEVTLLPTSMKSVATLVRVSNQLIRQSVVSVSQALEQRIVRDIANKLDATLIASATTDGTVPTGILNYSGIQTLSVGGALGLDNVLDALALAEAAYVNTSNLRFFMRGETLNVLRKIKTATSYNSYVLNADPANPGKFTVFGIPVTITNDIPVTGTTGSKVTKAVLADMSQVAVGRDLNPSVTIDTSRYLEYRQVAILAEARLDAAPMNAQAVIRLDGIAAQG